MFWILLYLSVATCAVALPTSQIYVLDRFTYNVRTGPFTCFNFTSCFAVVQNAWTVDAVVALTYPPVPTPVTPRNEFKFFPKVSLLSLGSYFLTLMTGDIHHLSPVGAISLCNNDIDCTTNIDTLLSRPQATFVIIACLKNK